MFDKWLEGPEFPIIMLLVCCGVALVGAVLFKITMAFIL